nr:MAG TPA: hypothetical protein [Caudoviricetes sp.]
MGFNRAITAKGAKPSEPAAASQRRMSAARPGELTRGAEIPSQLGGFASTRRPGRTGLRRDTPPGALSQVDHRYTARTARTTGFRQSSPPASGKALCVPRSPRLVVRGGPPNESPISVRV